MSMLREEEVCEHISNFHENKHLYLFVILDLATDEFNIKMRNKDPPSCSLPRIPEGVILCEP